jgi:hypothetical protein
MGTSIQPTSRKAIAKDVRQGSSMFAICMQSSANPQEQNVNPKLKRDWKTLQIYSKSPLNFHPQEK